MALDPSTIQLHPYTITPAVSNATLSSSGTGSSTTTTPGTTPTTPQVDPLTRLADVYAQVFGSTSGVASQPATPIVLQNPPAEVAPSQVNTQVVVGVMVVGAVAWWWFHRKREAA